MNKMKRDYTKPYLEETDVYLNDVVLYEIQSSLYDYKSDIPKDLLAEHYSNAIITILELRYVYKKDYSKEEFIKYFLELMDNQKIKFSK